MVLHCAGDYGCHLGALHVAIVVFFGPDVEQDRFWRPLHYLAEPIKLSEAGATPAVQPMVDMARGYMLSCGILGVDRLVHEVIVSFGQNGVGETFSGVFCRLLGIFVRLQCAAVPFGKEFHWAILAHSPNKPVTGGIKFLRKIHTRGINMRVNILKSIRQERGLTQEELAAMLKITVGMVSHIETGRREISPRRANEWASKLGVKREKLCPEVFGVAA